MGCGASREAAFTIEATDDDNASSEEVPLDAKAIFSVVTTPNGPDLTPGNPKLKMLLTSAGLMPESAPELLERYAALRSTASGKGVLFLMDAKLKTLQWQSHPSDPAPAVDSKYVTYKREPEKPGGAPVLGADGKPIPKSQAELASYGYHSVEYALRHNHHYSNAHLSIVAAAAAGEAVPVYLSYLSYDADGSGEYAIMLATGRYQNGEFTLCKADGSGEDFGAADYEASPEYTKAGSASFTQVDDAAFAAVVAGVDTIWSCGGVSSARDHASP